MFAPWTVAILPQMQETALFNAWAKAYTYTSDGVPEVLNVSSTSELSQICGTRVVSYYCPSRRAPAAYPGWIDTLTPTGLSSRVAKTDYGLNRGVLNFFPTGPVFSNNLYLPRPGIAEDSKIGGFVVGNVVRARDVTDGLSKTYLVGERAMLTNLYETVQNAGFPPSDEPNGSMFICGWGRNATGQPITRQFTILQRRLGGTTGYNLAW